jgi:hypothetical protein
MTSTFDAFVGPHFDPVFSDHAVAPWVQNAARLNLESFHAEARRAVERVVDAARDNLANPAMRVALIQGEAGLGKTHTVIAKLWQLSQDEKVYPVIMQLSANVHADDVSLWMLRSVVEQLDAHHFRDKHDRTPLRRLADSLWSFAPKLHRKSYDESIANDNEDDQVKFASRAARQIRQALSNYGIRITDDPLIAGVLLAADDASYAFRNWLRGSTQDERLGEFRLPALLREADRRGVLVAIAAWRQQPELPLFSSSIRLRPSQALEIKHCWQK